MLEKFIIHGGKPLKGEVRISGAKNAAVAILPAVLLADSPCVIENLPMRHRKSAEYFGRFGYIKCYAVLGSTNTSYKQILG